MIEELKKLKYGKIIENVNLEKYTSYKLKDQAKALIIVDNINNLKELLKFLKDNNIKHKIIGGGSNLIFDGYYDGVLIKLNLVNLKIDENIIEVESGYNLIALALKVAKRSLTGMEFATGIPGTVGGAIYNNSGAYGSDMGYIVKKVKVLTPDLQIKEMDNKELNYHYRTSFFKDNKDYVILSAKIVLRKGNKENIMDIIADRRKRRIQSQPLEYPSAGSVFRNPTNLYAGKLIEDIGYKGHMIGGAQISEKHANFIINKGHATGSDIVSLINIVKEKVKEKYNVDLVLEQEIVK